jgi:prepilin peptidase CpaA
VEIFYQQISLSVKDKIKSLNELGGGIGMTITSIVYLILILILSAVYDLRTHRIPNYLTISAMVLGAMYHTSLTGLNGFLFSFAGLFAGFGFLFIFYLMGGMGAGDVKLLGAVGSFLGAKGVFWSFLFSAIAGGLYSLILMLVYRKIFASTFSNLYYSGVHLIMTRKLLDFGTIHSDDRPRLCYGLAIAVGTGFYLFMKIYGIVTFPI